MHGKEFTWHRPVRMVLKMLLLWGRLWLLLWFSILAIAALWVQVPIYQWFIAFKSTRKLWFRELYHQIRKVLYILGFPPALFSSLVLWISCYSITGLTCRKVLQIAEQVQSIFHPWVKVASCSWGFYSVTDRRQGGGVSLTLSTASRQRFDATPLRQVEIFLERVRNVTAPWCDGDVTVMNHLVWTDPFDCGEEVLTEWWRDVMRRWRDVMRRWHDE